MARTTIQNQRLGVVREFVHSYSFLKIGTSLLVALISAMGTHFIERYRSERPTEDQQKYDVRVTDAASNYPIRGASIMLVSPDGTPQLVMTDEAGSAVFSVPVGKKPGVPLRIAVNASGYPPLSYNVIGNSDVISIPLVREGQTGAGGPPVKGLPYTVVYSSGPAISGPGGSFSGWYSVSAAAPREGFKIDADNSSYSLSGDRRCGAWAECVWVEKSPQRLSFKFRLQGHSEWPPPGQGTSEGILKTTYVPK